MRRWRQSHPLNVPNAISGFRLLAAPVLAYLGYRHSESAFVGLFCVMFFSDWLDGRLAHLLHERTALGARIDSIADAATGLALIFGLVWMRGPIIYDEVLWLVGVPITYAVSFFFALAKLGRSPSYHTYLAKSCWVLIGCAALVVVSTGRAWPVRVVSLAICVSNVEDIGITALLPRARTDVTSFCHVANRLRRKQRAAERLRRP